jgi:hypothetical protein
LTGICSIPWTTWNSEEYGGYCNLRVTLSLLPISLSDDDMFTLSNVSCVVCIEMSTTKRDTTKKCLPSIERQTISRRHTKAPDHNCYLDITLKSFGPQHAPIFCLRLASTGRARRLRFSTVDLVRRDAVYIVLTFLGAAADSSSG